MPVTRSAIKALRQSRARATRRQRFRKGWSALIEKTTASTLSSAVSLIDKAAKRRILHPNTAGRLKSRLMRRLAGQAPRGRLPRSSRSKSTKSSIQDRGR